MALTPGTRLGPYEVTAQIGVGGMGEVYKATDTNLKRAVAIKVLPASPAGDPERLARFQREAEVLASLNHPNIAAIYGWGIGRGASACYVAAGAAGGRGARDWCARDRCRLVPDAPGRAAGNAHRHSDHGRRRAERQRPRS